MPKPIYYIELELTVNSARSSEYRGNTWWIGVVHPDKLTEHFKSNASDFDRLLYIAFKKRKKAVKKKKMTGFNINIHSWKQVGFTNS